MEQNPAKVFSENWSIYQKMIFHNYMHHAEFAGKTAALFETLSQKNLHILDIGCGDVAPLLPVLQQAHVASYTGYDLSTAGLQLAAEHLKAHSFSSALKNGDMLSLILEEENQFDVIHSSFAIHHLQDDKKRELLQACYNKLLPGGKMIYTDVFRQPHISRDQYIDDYFSYIKNDWHLLTAEEKQPIYEHVRQYDFPSDIQETIRWIQLPGFSVSDSYQPDHRHTMLVLEKE